MMGEMVLMPNLSTIKKDIESKVSEANFVEYNYDFVKKNWDEFCAVKKSKGLTDQFIALSNARLELSKENENHIIVEFDYLENLNKFKSFEEEFLQQLKMKLHRQEIEFDVRFLDRSNEAVKIFTDKDRFEFMVSKNPNLSGLQEVLGLDFEY